MPNQSAVQVRSLMVHQELWPSLEITPFGNKGVKLVPEVTLWESQEVKGMMQEARTNGFGPMREMRVIIGQHYSSLLGF